MKDNGRKADRMGRMGGKAIHADQKIQGNKRFDETRDAGGDDLNRKCVDLGSEVVMQAIGFRRRPVDLHCETQAVESPDQLAPILDRPLLAKVRCAGVKAHNRSIGPGSRRMNHLRPAQAGEAQLFGEGINRCVISGHLDRNGSLASEPKELRSPNMLPERAGLRPGGGYAFPGADNRADRVFSHVSHQVDTAVISPIPKESDLTKGVSYRCQAFTMVPEDREFDRYIFADGTKRSCNSAKVRPPKDVNSNAAVSLRERIDKPRDDHRVAQMTKREDQAGVAFVEVTRHPLDPSFDKTG